MGEGEEEEEEEEEEEKRNRDEELRKKNQEIEKLNGLLKQMASRTRTSRAPTMVARRTTTAGGVGGGVKPSLLGGGRFSNINFAVPKNFDFLGYSQKVRMTPDADEETLVVSKSCPKSIAEAIYELRGADALLFTAQAEIMNSSMKKEENVTMVATGSKIFYFEAHSSKHRQEAVQLVTSETNLIVISNLSEALVIRAHRPERPADTFHIFLQTPYRTEFIIFLHEVLRRRHEARLTVHFQNKIVVKKVGPRGREVGARVIDFENQQQQSAQLERVNFANALQKGVLTQYYRKKYLKSKKWKEHFCVLTNVGLLQYKGLNVSDGIAELVPTIDSRVAPLDYPPKGGEFCFEIDQARGAGGAQDSLIFSLKTSDDRDAWLNGIRKLQRDFDQKRAFLLKKIQT